MNRVFIKTYGCQMNERDSESVACKLQERGYTVVDHEDKADIVLLNTCSVRERAEQKAIGKAGHLAKKKRNNPRFILGVMGCMAQNRGNDLVDRLPDLDLIVGTQKFHRLPDYLDQLIDSRDSRKEDSPSLLEIGEETGSENEIREHFAQRNKVTAFVSIMQGCNMNCAFCIVPKTRGKERYRSMEDIVSEVTDLGARGVREVTLLGQIVNAYGRGSLPRKDGKTPFVQLLERVHEIEAIERIRFTSPHPTSFEDDLIEAFGRLPKLCSYAHLPMQSGSDRILKLMNRPYTVERFLSIVTKLRTTCPSMRLSTDVIVGFPGESDKDFDLTKEAFSQAGFEHAFVFKYSERSGTPAAQFEDKVPQAIKESRNQELLSLTEKRSYASNANLIGSRMEILVEGLSRKGDGKLMGRTKCFRKVVFEGPGKSIGSLVTVRVKEASPYALITEQE
ncbi:MAG: tRNA (N6-isopentenyl adenosine(37)-C2)-methylthiotransferase MiaB [Opitutae bacterium]|jgi:tRNA-2-methylthio-N6-dimethylallyladenosine synthase|nr:tRNA (N6-isopentenyl adenosine(37)-C2)-methylthiotransferase MiaB [Opitutae bacterium]